MQLEVVNIGGDRHRITVRGHRIDVDQPVAAGGQDLGPTPVELFVASLASCVAHYARRALGPTGEGPHVHCSWDMSDTKPWRVTSIDIDVNLSSEVSPARLAAVQRAISHCTVHNSLAQMPSISIATSVGMPGTIRAA